MPGESRSQSGPHGGHRLRRDHGCLQGCRGLLGMQYGGRSLRPAALQPRGRRHHRPDRRAPQGDAVRRLHGRSRPTGARTCAGSAQQADDAAAAQGERSVHVVAGRPATRHVRRVGQLRILRPVCSAVRVAGDRGSAGRAGRRPRRVRGGYGRESQRHGGNSSRCAQSAAVPRGPVHRLRRGPAT